MLNFKNSEEHYKKSTTIFPGGVNSPVRAFKHIGITPIFIKNATGSKITDIDENSYIDYCLSWGALILGHSFPYVIRSVKQRVEQGTSYGLNTPDEVNFGELIKDAIPSIEMLRFVNSGTEAVMSAIRVARGFTGRKIIIKFDGCYHGHSDFLLVNAGSGVSTIPSASSKGVPAEFLQNTVSLPFNDIKILTDFVEKNYKDIACIILEPVPANMGVVLPEDEFLYKIEKLTKKYEIVLIFDEVITGFRFCWGGVQNLFNITPDLTCLGKIIGGGFPVGAFGGKKEIMCLLSPEGKVYQAGTLSGNPVAITAGFSTLEYIKNNNVYTKIEKLFSVLKPFFDEINQFRRDIKISYFKNMFSIFFTEKLPQRFSDVILTDKEKFKNMYIKLLNRYKIFLSPSPFETNFLSFSHTYGDVEYTLKSLMDVLLN